MNDVAQDGWRPRRPDGGTVTAGPFATDAEAAAAARALGGPPEPGWSILSPEQRLAMLTRACEEAGVTLGACDARVLAWLAGWEDGVCAVVAGLVTRAHAAEAASARDAVWDDGLLVCSTCGAPADRGRGCTAVQHLPVPRQLQRGRALCAGKPGRAAMTSAEDAERAYDRARRGILSARVGGETAPARPLTTVSFTAAREGFAPVPGVVVNVLMTAVPHVGRYVTGGCAGGDAFVGEWLHANRPGAEHVAIVPANRSRVDPWWLTVSGPVTVIEMPPGTTYADRNARLVAEGTFMFGFPAYPEDDLRSRRSGSWQTIRMARQAGKLSQWHCVTPPYQGRVERYPDATPAA